MKYVMLMLLWISFCVLHSGLITTAVTSFLKRNLGDKYRFYRLFYNAVSIVTLIPAVVYTHSIRQTPFFRWEGYLAPVRYLLLVSGILIAYAGARHYDMRAFLGLRQLSAKVDHNLINTTGRIDSTGILGMIRHPFYSGSILLLWSGNLDTTRLIVNIILTVYLVAGTLLEEQKLIRELGDEYNTYRQQVSMLFPVKWLRKKLL